MDKTSNDGRLEENLADVFIDMIVMKTDEVDSKPNSLSRSLAPGFLFPD